MITKRGLLIRINALEIQADLLEKDVNALTKKLKDLPKTKTAAKASKATKAKD